MEATGSNLYPCAAAELLLLLCSFGENKHAPQTLRLWSLETMLAESEFKGEGATPYSVCVFKGHASPIVAFDWRSGGGGAGGGEEADGGGACGTGAGGGGGGGQEGGELGCHAAADAFQLVSLNRSVQVRLHAIAPVHLIVRVSYLTWFLFHNRCGSTPSRPSTSAPVATSQRARPPPPAAAAPKTEPTAWRRRRRQRPLMLHPRPA